jgi:hypothetical protein
MIADINSKDRLLQKTVADTFAFSSVGRVSTRVMTRRSARKGCWRGALRSDVLRTKSNELRQVAKTVTQVQFQALFVDVLH